MTEDRVNLNSAVMSNVNICWYAGAVWDDGDHADEFVEKGIWVNGYKNRFINEVKSVRVGDRIAIKSSCTQKNNLPFDINGGTASLMKIKVTGVVIKNEGDGRTLYVKWDRPFDTPKMWYFFTNRSTLWRVERNSKDSAQSELLDFTFSDKCQDYKRYLNTDYWRKKYGLDSAQELASSDEYMEYADEYMKYIRQLLSSYNLVLTGSPGTGKTHLAHAIANELDAEFEFVQFHPSYDYTDFVEGLRPVGTDESGNIRFERLDGIFKAFCKKALRNCKDSSKTIEQLQKEIDVEERVNTFLENAQEEGREFKTVKENSFIIAGYDEDTITVHATHIKKQSLSIKKGEVEALIENNVELSKVRSVSAYFKKKHKRQQDSYIYSIVTAIRDKQYEINTDIRAKKINKKFFVFIIDEINRGDLSKIFGELFFAIDRGYRKSPHPIKTQYQNLVEDSDPFSQGFFIPDNVYIIATMNDIDRSVDNMDFAMRRRFAWMEVSAEESAQMMNLDKSALEVMQRTNKAIADTPGLGKLYELGGAYFLEKISDEKRWSVHIKNLLGEYLRGIDQDGSKIAAIEKAYFGKNEE